MNLHGIVRGAIGTVNPDIPGVFRSNQGYATSAAGARAPNYTDTDVMLQVQALTAKELQHPDMLNVQGVKRGVYMFGNPQGVVRPDVKGGDLLQFPQVKGGPIYTWLVCAVLETWTPDTAGWGKVGVSLQMDTPVTPP